MIASKAAPHYSKALFNLTQDDVQLNAYAKSLWELADLMRHNPAFKSFLLQPFGTMDFKKKILKKLFQDSSEVKVLNFLFLLLEKKRMDALPEIADEYGRMVNEKLGQMIVNITTAIPIDGETIEKLRLMFEEQYRKKVFIKDEINPKILGGMIVKINSQMLDGSLKARLANLKDKLLAANL